MKIAILDDDQTQTDFIGNVVMAAGYQSQPFLSVSALLSVLRRDTFDLIIVDWNMPERSGLDAIRWVRTNLAPPPPMLLVTSRTAEADIVEGLAAGADDYLAKPLSPALLAGKIAALLRRAYPLPSGAGTEHHGGFEFDAAGATVRLDGVVIPVTAKEFALALVLFRNLERALSRTYLTDAVWGTEPGVTSRSLDMHISRVRTKLDLRPEHGFRLTPIYSYGYRLERVRVEPAA